MASAVSTCRSSMARSSGSFTENSSRFITGPLHRSKNCTAATAVSGMASLPAATWRSR